MRTETRALANRIKEHRDEIYSIIAANHGLNPRIVHLIEPGSNSANARIEILVDPTDATTAFDLGRMQYQLSELLDTYVAMVDSSALSDRERNLVLRAASAI